MSAARPAWMLPIVLLTATVACVVAVFAVDEGPSRLPLIGLAGLLEVTFWISVVRSLTRSRRAPDS